MATRYRQIDRSRSKSRSRSRSRSPQRSNSQAEAVRNSNVNQESEDDSYGDYSKGQVLYVYPALRVAVSGMSGILFGIALEKGRVFEPQIIRDQMLMRRFVMLKMFLAASATGMVSFSLLSVIPKTREPLRCAIREFSSGLHTKTVLGVTIGGALLGCGMTVAGSCPGLVLVQVGAGVSTAVYTIGGALFGGLLYAATYPLVSRAFHTETPRSQNYLHESLNTNYVYLAVPMAVALAGVIAGFEYLFPWQTEVTVTEEAVGLLRMSAWPPFLAGMLVGSLQIPMVLANQDTLGSSTSYITIGSQILFIKPLQKILAYMKRFRWGLHNWWQVVYMGGAILGAFLSAQAAGGWASIQGVVPWQAFGGGVLMVYGSRLAGGCTSGHGLSGMGLLGLFSFVAVPAMFKAGIGTAFAMKFMGFPEFQ